LGGDSLKQRILTGAVGILLVAVFLFLRDTVALNLIISALSVVAIWEIFVATQYVGNRLLLITCWIFAAAVPFFRNPYFSVGAEPAVFLFVVLIFGVMLYEHKEVKIEQIGLVFMMSTVIPFAFSCIIYIRDLPANPDMGLLPEDGLFLMILVVLGAWCTDIGGYFVGRFFGRHKMAPTVSPKKTVEGAIGGAAFTLLSFMAAGLIYQRVSITGGAGVSYPLLAVMAVLCSAAAMLGDLAASFIKRCCHVKDFGHIMPGHGGVLDRFDSVLLVASLVYLAAGFFPLISRV